MKNRFYFVLCFCIFLSCKKDFTKNDTAVKTSVHVDNLTFNDTASQFGVFVNASYSSQSPGPLSFELNLTNDKEFLLDSTYGAKNIRIQINHDV